MRPAPFHQARIAAELAQLEKGVEFGCRIAVRALQKGQQIADCRQRRLLPETVRRHLCPQDCGSLSDAGPSGSPRQGPRLALGVNRHMVQIGLGHRDLIQLGRVALGIGFCRNSAKRSSIAARPTLIKKRVSRTGSLRTRLDL